MNEQSYTPSLDEVRAAYLVIAKASYDDDQNAFRRMIEAVRAEEREKAERERDAANARADALVRENLALAQERDEALARVRELEEA